MRGANHPQQKHGQETLEAKAERHGMAVFFHETENLIAKLGMLAPGSTRTRGRKPKSECYVAVTNVVLIPIGEGRHLCAQFFQVWDFFSGRNPVPMALNAKV